MLNVADTLDMLTDAVKFTTENLTSMHFQIEVDKAEDIVFNNLVNYSVAPNV